MYVVLMSLDKLAQLSDCLLFLVAKSGLYGLYGLFFRAFWTLSKMRV